MEGSFVKIAHTALIGFVSILGLTSPATSVEIISVGIERVSKAHLCRKLGGADKDITVTIRHEKKDGDRIKVKMYDRLSSGKLINHRSKTVKSEAGGTTVFTHNFLAPCNRTGNTTSTYYFDASSGSSAKKGVKWFSYDSRTKRIK